MHGTDSNQSPLPSGTRGPGLSCGPIRAHSGRRVPASLYPRVATKRGRSWLCLEDTLSTVQWYFAAPLKLHPYARFVALNSTSNG